MPGHLTLDPTIAALVDFATSLGAPQPLRFVSQQAAKWGLVR
jgi:hypothetical protein